eukprot:gene23653-biopygen8765
MFTPPASHLGLGSPEALRREFEMHNLCGTKIVHLKVSVSFHSSSYLYGIDTTMHVSVWRSVRFEIIRLIKLLS